MSDIHSERHADAQMRHFIRESGLPLRTFAKAVGWNMSKALEWWSKKEDAIEERNLESLAKHLGIRADSILDNSFDLSLIRQRIIDGPEVLPEQYAENASSYVRTLAHIVEYLSMLHGRQFTDNLLRSLSIHPLFFDNLENKISLKFYKDVFNELSRRGARDSEIASLACYIFLSLKNTEIGKKFRSAKDHQESYAILAENATLFETNFEYEFDIHKDRIRIIARPTEATLELFKKSPEEYRRLFLYRKNVFSWFPTLSDLAPLTMQTPQCILRGDAYTVYEAAPPVSIYSTKKPSYLKILKGVGPKI